MRPIAPIGDTVMGWIGGPFSTHWDQLASFRERLALEELEFIDQDIQSIAREVSAIEEGRESGLANAASEMGLPLDSESQLAYLQAAYQEAQDKRTELLEKNRVAKDEDPSLEARYEEALHVYQQQAATAAVMCCMDIWEAVSQQEGEDTFHELSVGIASGLISVGNYGSTDQIGFTVLGPTVDRATRLEPASAQYGCSLLIDQATYDLVKETADLQFRMLPLMAIPGVAEPMVAYEPLKPEAVSQAFIEMFHEGVFAVQRHDLDKAMTCFERAHQGRDGGDAVSLQWLEECRAAQREGRRLEIEAIDA